MKQIRAILNNLNEQRPRLLTLFTSYSNAKMLEDFETYCLVNQPFFEPRVREILPNLLCVADATELDFDLCVSFSGGPLELKLLEIAKKRGIDCITYENNFINDLRTDTGYIASNKKSYFPCLGFSEKCYGNGNILLPNISKNLNSFNPITARPIDLMCMGEFLIEKEEETNFSDWKYISNTIPSMIYGFNPRIGSYTPRTDELPAIYNQVKILVNTRTSGLFPIEILEAMACGCIVISYPYPGIENFGVVIVNNKEECRKSISDFLSDKNKMMQFSAFNIVNSLVYKDRNDLKELILKRWREINEFGFQHYRISGV